MERLCAFATTPYSGEYDRSAFPWGHPPTSMQAIGVFPSFLEEVPAPGSSHRGDRVKQNLSANGARAREHGPRCSTGRTPCPRRPFSRAQSPRIRSSPQTPTRSAVSVNSARRIRTRSGRRNRSRRQFRLLASIDGHGVVAARGPEPVPLIGVRRVEVRPGVDDHVPAVQHELDAQFVVVSVAAPTVAAVGPAGNQAIVGMPSDHVPSRLGERLARDGRRRNVPPGDSRRRSPAGRRAHNASSANPNSRTLNSRLLEEHGPQGQADSACPACHGPRRGGICRNRCRRSGASAHWASAGAEPPRTSRAAWPCSRGPNTLSAIRQVLVRGPSPSRRSAASQRRKEEQLQGQPMVAGGRLKMAAVGVHLAIHLPDQLPNAESAPSTALAEEGTVHRNEEQPDDIGKIVVGRSLARRAPGGCG